METNICASWLLAMEARVLSETSLSLSRVMMTRSPVLDSISFFSLRLIFRVTFFSCSLDRPTAPRSSPPWPGSMQIVSMGLGLVGAAAALPGQEPDFFRRPPGRRRGGAGALALLTRSNTTRKGFSRTKFFLHRRRALVVDGEHAFAALVLAGHPLQQLRVGHGQRRGAEIGAAGQAHLQPVGAVLHLVGEGAVGLEDDAGVALVVERAEIDP